MASGDITTKSGSEATITITLASLGTSATRVAGRESNSVSKADPETDHIITGKITVGTSPTGGQIDIWVVPIHKTGGGDVWPDVFDGTDSAETATSVNVLYGLGFLAKVLASDTTTDRVHNFSFGVRAACGYMPRKYVIFVAHSTGVNLNSTGGNHEMIVTPQYEFVTP